MSPASPLSGTANTAPECGRSNARAVAPRVGDREGPHSPAPHHPHSTQPGKAPLSTHRSRRFSPPLLSLVPGTPFDKNTGEARGLACPCPVADHFLRTETISMTFTSLSPNVLNTLTTIRSLLSMMTSSRPLTFWPLSGQQSSLAHSNLVPELLQLARPCEIVPHRPQTLTTVYCFRPRS